MEFSIYVSNATEFTTASIKHCVISIGNHMISSEIWNKYARVNFSKTNKIARGRRASAIWGQIGRAHV